MPSFKHEPFDLLEPGIRLLRLLSSGFADATIECEIFQALGYNEDTIAYEALSYVWGDTRIPRDELPTITVNGQCFPITANLHGALKALRQAKSDRLLWVDAICINQNDDYERMHQVQQMGDIYSSAEQVIFWLGAATHNTTVLMSDLRELQRLSVGHPCSKWSASDGRWKVLWATVRSKNNAVDTAAHVAGLRDLLQRPWFERMWIIPEVAKAQRAIVQCDSSSVAARIFALAPILLNVAPPSSSQPVLDIMPGPSRRSSWYSQNQDLYNLLIKFSDRQALDERDKVYALLGITSGENLHLYPNYTLSVRELLSHVIYSIFGVSGITRYDTLAQFSHWAPNFGVQYLQRIVLMHDSVSLLRILDAWKRSGTDVAQQVIMKSRNSNDTVVSTNAIFKQYARLIEHIKGTPTLTPEVLWAVMKISANGSLETSGMALRQGLPISHVVPLNSAIRERVTHVGIIQELLAHGADPEKAEFDYDGSSITPMKFALKMGLTEILDLFVAHKRQRTNMSIKASKVDEARQSLLSVPSNSKLEIGGSQGEDKRLV